MLLAVLVTLSPSLSWRDVGVRRPRAGWWVPVVGVVGGALGLQALIGPLSTGLTPDLETSLFQSLVPGLDEELFFRGVLLLLLDRALRARRSMWGGQVGWSVVISTLLFGLGHGLAVQSGPELVVEPASIVTTALVGLLLVWLRVRWDSLWPVFLAHNGWNASVVVANALS
ncbi:hypothetical protein GCM10009718_03970 [Isoptericola halotolerans]